VKDALGRPESVLVIGATSAIARAVLSELVGGGTRRLVLAARDSQTLATVAAEMKALGADEVQTMAFDALDTATHPSMIEAAFSGRDIDVVVLSWGILGAQASDEHDPTAAAEVMAVNATASVSVGIACADALANQGHGTMVAISSVAGERARRSNFIYGASKAGMDAFFQGLRDSLESSGVDVVIVRPGFVHTRMTASMPPAPLATDAATVAKATVAAIARGSGTVWVPGALRYVMAVMRHLPRSVFRRLPV
jgi:decaprenylphospho-beta-D-erythro-pentofuranosid-2-ulose 2-reductase